MTHRRLAAGTIALVAAAALAAPAPAEAGGWFGLHIGTGGVGVSFGLGSWWEWTDAWASGPTDLDFELALAGYGEWIRVDGLGRVWRPWVSADWRPYTNGRWVWTSVGWTWVAYEPWGYLPHHFGNWALTSAGWAWMPGGVYTPASVIWVGGGGMVGWYACPPHGWSHAHRGFWRGTNHGWRDGYRSGYRDGWDDARYASFVAWDRMTDDDLPRRAVAGYAVPRGSRVEHLAAPPSRTEVARRSGRAVPEVRLEQRTVRVAGRDTTLARPVGLEASVAAHADDTVRRALSPRVSSELESARTRTVPAARGASGRSETRVSPSPTSSRNTRPDILRSQPAPSARRSVSVPDGARREETAAPSSSRRPAARSTAEARIQPAPSARPTAASSRSVSQTRSGVGAESARSGQRSSGRTATTASPSVARPPSQAAPTPRREAARAAGAPAGTSRSVQPAPRSSSSARAPAATSRPAPSDRKEPKEAPKTRGGRG